MVLAHGGYKKIAKKGDVLKRIQITKGTEEGLDCIYSEDVGGLIKKGTENNVAQEINIKEVLQAPIYKGDKVGEVKYILNGEEIQRVDIVASKDILKSNLWTVTTNLFNNWFKMNR